MITLETHARQKGHLGALRKKALFQPFIMVQGSHPQ
jgi:hypothetical protein